MASTTSTTNTIISSLAHLQIPLVEVLKATNNFDDDNVISDGDFGKSYTGQLFWSDQWIKIVARRLDRDHGPKDYMFWTEISMLSDLKHTNLISIIGFCDEKDEKVIITTYDSKGSLGRYLNKASLTWTQRLRISVGVARALRYLNSDEGRNFGVVHRNINRYTILLDENWEAKLSGFEISIKQAANRMDRVIVSEPVGMIGYMDPEIEKIKGVTQKSDIYALGVVLFELLYGRRAYIQEEAKPNRFLASVAKKNYENRKLKDIIHPDLRNQLSLQSLDKYSTIAYLCLKDERVQRPDVDFIVAELEEALNSQLRRENFEKKLEHIKIPLSDIKLATNNFSAHTAIAILNHCALHIAELDHFDEEINHSSGERKHNKKRSNVVIKRYPHFGHRVFGEEQFFTEIEMLTSVKHPNIVNLLGFCVEDFEMILVINHDSNGYLGLYLRNINDKYTCRILTWEKRLKICIDVAHALNYLHYEMEDQKTIITRAVQSSSITLDENMRAKIVDFWFSVFLPPNLKDEAIYVKTNAGRTYSLDPEYEITYKLKRETDVYSFGVLLLEILCGRAANDPIYLEESDKGLAPVAKRCFNEGTLEDMIDPLIKEENNFVLPRGPNKDSLDTFIKIAFQCVAETQDKRPTMKIVLQELEKALIFQENNKDNLRMSLEEVKLATQNFHGDNCIGGGGGSIEKVYIGNITQSDGFNTIVAKRFGDQEHQQFLKELQILSEYKHENIIGLRGYCVEKDEKIIVYEYASRRSLDRYLEDASLTWMNRLNICIDVASALHFLHGGVERKSKVSHRNIKTTNILLNQDWKAKLSNFRFSLICPINQVTDDVIGVMCDTPEYLDPLYIKSGLLTKESDIFSFGVVLFEILCGRSAFAIQKHEDHYLPHFIGNYFEEGKQDEVVFEQIKDQIVSESLTTFQMIAYQCLHLEREKRPTTEEVLVQLKKALEFQEKVQHQNTEEKMDQVVQNTKTDQIVKNTEEKRDQVVENTEEKRDQVVENTKEKTDQVVENTKEKTDQVVENKEETTDQVFDMPQETSENWRKDLKKIPLTDIKLATNNFSRDHRISSWEIYPLYRAELNLYEEGEEHNTTVIIKRYPKGHKMFTKEQFFTEIKMLTIVKHHNIVNLLGYCDENSEMIIVTQNVFNGYLDSYLGNIDKMRILTWEKRLKICLDAAHVLNYLHYEMKDRKIIISREINSGNIGLDDNWGAKICHFGLSVLLHDDKPLNLKQSCYRSYIDPAYLKTGKLTRESDVYTFGLLLFEILSGKRASDPIYKKSEKGLPSVVRRNIDTGTLEDMIDPIIKEETSENSFVLKRGPNKISLNTFIKIAQQCVEETQDRRPTMKVVVKELEKALFFQKNNKDSMKFSSEEIIKATQNFHKNNFIGGGGFGKVYKGNLQFNDAFKLIAAKRLKTGPDQGEQDFLTELQILLEYKHENIIGLLGYTDGKDEKIIVYEYASRGCLNRYLNNAFDLTWVKRLNICIDIASALYFLHGGVGKQAKVIHRDIKTANILLHHNWKACLADFGLSLITPLIQETDYVIDHACGTPGYVDPLYKESGYLTTESDVYSFGVVLFEILCGRSTYAIQKQKGFYLPDLVKNIFEEGNHDDELVFEEIRKHIMPKSLTTFQEIAYQCLHHEREKRPSTKKVLMQLKKALELQKMPSTMTKFGSLKIPLEVVLNATNNFHHDNIIGQDAFGATYKGWLLWLERCPMKIVARRFDCKQRVGDLEFLKEISMLYDLKHTNLVPIIIGFCDEKDERIIVSKYEAGGSLGQYLNSPNLTWSQRLRISVGVARALAYLHYKEGRNYAIIHCNINSDTILLDENWDPKLSGFETSIKQPLVHYDAQVVCLWEHIGTMIRCMDPAIEKTGGVTHKSDIYSLGILLFELLCGRKAIIEDEANKSLDSLAKYHYENKTLNDIIHPDVYSNQMSPKSLIKYSNVAYSCLNEDPALRPQLNDIVEELEKALELQLPVEYTGEKLKHLKIGLNDIKLATNNFAETYRIISWDHINWYKAELNHNDEIPGKNTVIMKRYPSEDEEYGEEAFLTEIDMLSCIKHPNVVTILGFCIEGSEMIIITENTPNGYLGHDYLGNDNRMCSLTWEKRLKICIDVAQAVNHLHFEMEDQKMIINRDINSRNIMLDENMGAKIVDFWFSIYMPPNQQNNTLYLNKYVGRHSYIDPVYAKTGILTKESDVYSFGVVLFEILCDKELKSVLSQNFDMKTVEEVIDPIIKDETNNTESLQTFIAIAQHCVKKSQYQRPTMKVVIKELKKALLYCQCAREMAELKNHTEHN